MDRTIFEQRLAVIKMNQREIAEAVGMRPQRLSDMLADRLKGYKYRRRISQCLGVQEEILFPDDGNKPIA